MKRYAFALIALVVAIGAVAFTTARVNKDFRLKATASPLVQADVNNPYNWEEAVSITCDGQLEQPCRITNVAPAYYHGSPAILNKVLSEGTIAVIGSTKNTSLNTFYVTSFNAPSSAFLNKTY